MDSLNLHRKRYRRSFNKIEKILDFPNLIDIQKSSYENFLQALLPPEKRKPIGMEEVFRSVFPIKDFNETCSLEYVRYALGKPKYDVDECTQRGMTYAIPIKIIVQLVKWDKDPDTGVQSIRDVKEQEVYFGEIPLMTENGTFIINGTERVIVSQMHRSPGVFFDHDKGKTHTGKILYSARIIPYRGSWLDFEFDTKDILYVRIDRRRKLPATILLKALGFTTDELLKYFYKEEQIYRRGGEETFTEIRPPGARRETRHTGYSGSGNGRCSPSKGEEIPTCHDQKTPGRQGEEDSRPNGRRGRPVCCRGYHGHEDG